MITFHVEDHHDADLVIKALSGVVKEMADASLASQKTAFVEVLNKSRARLWKIQSEFENQLAEQLADQDEDGEDREGEEVEE